MDISKGLDRLHTTVETQEELVRRLQAAGATSTQIAGVPVRDVVNSMGYADARQVSYYDRDKDSLARNATHMVSAFVEGA